MSLLLLVWAVAMLWLAVDVASRGPERRAIERRRRYVRSGLEVPLELPKARVVLRHMRRDRW